MILVIRISGQINLRREIKETLHRIGLRRKYSAILLEETKENKKLLTKIRDYVAYGKINSEILGKLVKLRGQVIAGKKADLNSIEIKSEKFDLKEKGLKPFFRLHSPRGGIESKKHFGVGKGVLGNNKEKINELVERML